MDHDAEPVRRGADPPHPDSARHDTLWHPKTADQDQWRNSRTERRPWAGEPSPLTRPNPLHLIEHGLQPLATTRSRHPAGRVIVPAASQADARTRRPAESASTLAICFASSAALLRLGTIRTSVIRPIRSVTAAAAANAISGS